MKTGVPSRESQERSSRQVLGYLGLSAACVVIVLVPLALSSWVTSNECFMDSLGKPRNGDCHYGTGAEVAQLWVPLAIPAILAVIGAMNKWNPVWLLPAVPLGWLAALCGYLYVVSA